jgi:hypothetical protein
VDTVAPPFPDVQDPELPADDRNEPTTADAAPPLGIETWGEDDLGEDEWDDEEEDTATDQAPSPFQDASTDVMEPSDLAWYWSDNQEDEDASKK